jgi:hypothetical protein
VELVADDGQFYVIVNGLKIAKRENRHWPRFWLFGRRSRRWREDRH